MTNYRSLFLGALVVGASVGHGGYRLSSEAEAERAVSSKAVQKKGRSVELPLPNILLRVTPDDLITVFIGKSEMGQGVCTSLPMIVAGEMAADWERVRFEFSPPGEEYIDPDWGSQTTGGSTSVRHLYKPLRKAGAAAREMLIKAASDLWGVDVGECEAEEGKVLNRKSGESLTYGELCLRAAELPVPRNPRLKKERDLIGRSVRRLDIPDKVRGTAVFGTDVFVPDMLYAVIARPPAFGAGPVGFDEDAAGRISGVRRILRIAEGIGVCAESIDSALKGRAALKATWSAGAQPDLNDEYIEKMFMDHLDRKGKTARNDGDAVRMLRRAARKIEATYFLPYLAHATMEPMNCTAHVLPERCDIWAPTQDQSGVIQAAAGLTGLKPEQIYVHTTYLGGGFGRRLETDYAEEAVRLSKAVGRPVKLMWTREEDMGNDFYRPGCCARMEGGLDDNGRFAAWSQKVVVPSIFSRVSPDSIEHGIDPAAVEGLADTEYEVPDLRTEYVRIDLPIPVGFWRSVGHSHNAFIVESFVDEMAAASGKDPLEFRLELLRSHRRAARVLEVVAEKAGWGRRKVAGVGRGIAWHYSFGSHVAQVAEVTVDEKTGKIRVNRVVCAVDCGRVINPAILVAQIKGGIIFGLSAALKEAVRFGSGGVKSANFNNYGMLRMREAPEIEVHPVPGNGPVGGIGEVGVPPIAPAVMNAAYDATGIRLRRLPAQPEAIRLFRKS